MVAEDLTIALRGESTVRHVPYHRQVYEQLRRAILVGNLNPGDRLPSSRGLASRLGLARNTVARAYDDLIAEGFVTGEIGSGTYVAAGLGSEARGLAGGATGPGAHATSRAFTEWGSRVQREVPDGQRGSALAYDFRLGTPDWEAFPHALWLRLLGRAVRRQAGELGRYGDPAGYPPLRQAIARHLALSRGVAATAEQVVIVSGSQQALDVLIRLHVGPGDHVVVEEPGYPDARRAFAAAGARLIHVPVDAEGLDTDSLVARTATKAPRLVYVTPSHQFPTGVTLSLTRRLALLDWAARREVLIVEDDYDSEFRYTGRPVESLQGLDHSGRVAYVGTFSTVLFPPLRVGYVVLPPDLVSPFVKAKWLADRQTPTLEQLALTDFLAEGHFAQHLRRMRRLGAARRAALLAAVEESLGEYVAPPVASTGMHVMLRLPNAGPTGEVPFAWERAVVARAAALGVGIYPVEPCCAGLSVTPAILLGYAALTPERIREGIRRLARVLGTGPRDSWQ